MNIDRRTLLNALGTAGLAGMTANAAAGSSSAEVGTGAKHVPDSSRSPGKVIDVHTHMYSPRFDALKAAGDENVRVQPGPHGDAMIYRWAGIGTLGPEMYDWARRW
jgi:hypothetical protein